MQVANSTDKTLEFYITSSEISNLPTKDVPVGSSAFVLDTSAVLIFNNDTKTWVEL